ncbi:MAG: exo-alpha-sialidase, partial [Phycisphaeraceae bacterium JB051]
KLGPILALNPDQLPEAGRLKLDIADPSQVSEKQALALKALVKDVKKRNEIKTYFPPQAVDPCRLVEPTLYTTRDGRQMSLMRDDRFSHRMYVSLYDPQTKTWCKGLPTNIPDSPSLSEAANVEDGRVLLVGNNMATEFDKQTPRHYGRDPLMISVSYDGYRFTSAYALRCGRQSFKVPFVRGRGGGAQYPDVKIVGDKVYVLYSMGKEDIAISVVPLSDLK